MRSVPSLGLVVLLAAAVGGCKGCGGGYPTPPPTTTLSPTTVPSTTLPTTTLPTPTCTAPAIDPDRSLVVHDPAALAAAFGLRRTLQAIIDTSGNPATTPEALLQTMLDSFAKTSFVQPVSGKTIPVDARAAEAALPAADLLNLASPNAMMPVGLFNRLDLAPADGSNCGEYRIVYALKQPNAGRFLIIFESRLPNPAPATGLAGCQPIAQFWGNLSTNTDPASRLAALETFYYQGMPATSFGPVVAHANYGVPLGQVRTNLFMTPVWMLREHRTTLDPVTALPVFVADTVKESPLGQWFRDPSGLPSGITVGDQQAFRTHFLDEPVCNLVRPDRANATPTDDDIVNGIGSGFDPAGDDFQSVSHDLTDDPANDTEAVLTTAVATRLTQLGVAAVGPTELLNRAGAMTCGGCHQFSNGRFLGVGNTHPWPASKFFVHIDEQGGLSDALTKVFLPRRQQILTRMFCDPTPEPVSSPPCPGPKAPVQTAAPQAASEALPSQEGFQPQAAVQLRKGRTLPSLTAVDDARIALLAAARRAAGPPEGAPKARASMVAADKALEVAVQRARAAERALPGAFVPVRRTH